jgi:serine protease AprX
MTKTLQLLAILGVMFLGMMRVEAQQTTARFMVSFTDKMGTPYQLNNPAAFLSQRAIDRREKFGLPLTQEDLPVSPDYLDSLKAMPGVKLLSHSRWFNAALVEVQDSADVMVLLQFPFVADVDLLFYQTGSKKKQQLTDPLSGIKSMEAFGMVQQITAPSSGALRYMDAVSNLDYGHAFAQANQIGATYLHQLGFTGDSLQIAVLDAGFTQTDVMPAFDSLRINNQIISTRNFVDPAQTVYSTHYHGTYVLSVMGANQPGVIVGTAPHALYHLLLTEDVSSEFPVEEFYWALGAEYADSIGADMINSSLGYTTFDLPSLNYTFNDMNGRTALAARAATMASRRGMIVAASAGNGGGSSWFIISSPGDADSILTVGAVDVAGLYAPFSSTGKSADDRIKPDVVATGWLATIADPVGGHFLGNGTSFSSPVLCGAVACLWQANPHMSNHQVMDAVRKSAHQYHYPDTLLGFGIPNMAIAHLKLGGTDFPSLNDDNSFVVSPNPFYDRITVTFSTKDTQQVALELFNISGRQLYTKQHHLHPGDNLIHLSDLDQLNAGVYVLMVTLENKVITRKVVRR